MKSLILAAALMAGGSGVHAAELAAYNAKDSYDTVVVSRDAGKVQLLICNDMFPGDEDPTNTNAVLQFMQKHCESPLANPSAGLTTNMSVNYITGGTEAIVSISQVYENPADGADAGELLSQMSTYMVNTYKGNPVGPNDTIVYTGAVITHDHAATPKISTARLTYELQGVTRIP